MADNYCELQHPFMRRNSNFLRCDNLVLANNYMITYTLGRVSF